MLSQKLTRAWIWTLLALMLTYGACVELRTHRLEQTIPSPLYPFWIESAQRFRGVRIIAEGHALPNPDRQMQWPDGYVPNHDTVVQEYLLGLMARALQPADLHVFVRSATRYLYCLIVFPLFWLGYELTRRKWAGWFGATLYLTLPAAVDRSTGLVLYRENIMMPLLALHLAALYAHFRRENGTRFIWLSGVALVLSHLTWKVTTFYQLLVLGFLTLLCLWRPPGPRVRAAVYSLAGLPLATSIVVPLNLHHDRYWGTSQAALSGGLLMLCLAAKYRPTWVSSPFVRAALVGAVALALRAVLPGGASYGHAWATVIAKLEHFGQKPADPAQLSLSARHYWTGNYQSPSLMRVLRDFTLPVLFCIFLVRRLGRNERPSLGSLERYAHLFLVLGLLGSIAGYAMFVKFGTFFALFMTPALALCALTLIEQAKHRLWLGIIVLALTLGISGLASWNGVGIERALNLPQSGENDQGVVYGQEALWELNDFITRNTTRDQVLLATWAFSPYLTTYLDRTTILNSFFESDMVYRYETFNLKLFGPLSDFHTYCRANDAEYFLYEANLLLRTDPWMSYRYVANKLTLSGEEAAYQLHYAQDALPGFELVFQNDFFRIFKVLKDSSEVRPFQPVPYAALFDPAVPGAQPGQPLEDGPNLLYNMREASRWLALGKALERGQEKRAALEAYRSGLSASPFQVKIIQQLIPLLVELGQPQAAQQLEASARKRFGPALPLPSSQLPPPVPSATK